MAAIAVLGLLGLWVGLSIVAITVWRIIDRHLPA